MKKTEYYSFTELYDEHRQTVLHHVLFFCKDRELAKDMSQEIFLKLWKRHEKLSLIEDMPSYLFLVTRNLAIDYYQQQQKEQIGKTALSEHYWQFYPPPENELYDSHLCDIVYKDALQQLTPRQRQIFLMLREIKLTRKQAAFILGVSENTVKSSFQIAKRTLLKYASLRLGNTELLKSNV